MKEPPSSRDAGQILFIGLKVQSETLLALLKAGAVPPEALREIVFSISMVSDSWREYFPEGPGMFEATLAELRLRVGLS